MRIAWIVPCRYVEVHENLATIVGGGIDRVYVPFLPAPGPIQVLCATRIVADISELDEPGQTDPKHELVCRVHAPDMQLVSELKQPFGMNGEPDARLDPAAIIPIGVVFAPVEVGQYTIEIAVDERGLSFPMTVEVQESPATPE